MSTPPVLAAGPDGKPRELAVYHHSNLFYWWPVWLVGFILFGVTWYEDSRMAIVPKGTRAIKKITVKGEDGKDEQRDVLVLPPDKEHHTHQKDGEIEIDQPYVKMSRRRGLGTLFVAVLLLVIIITNVTMRGLWSVLVILVLVMLSIIFYLADWWDIILQKVQILAIHINLSGYLAISLLLFAAWLINFFLFDRQTYMIFSPGQVRARLTIGGGETVYGTTGMVVQKQRGDMFRHWILGFGSGDLIIRPAGLQTPIEMPNVLNVGRVVKQIEQMVKEQVVVRSN
jgi:hypothetical protein